VLVRCPTWLGDTVMALPTIRALGETWPGAELWCQGPWVPALLAGESAVTRRMGVPRDARGWIALTRELRAARLDVAVLLPNSFRSGLEAWLAGARWRVGYATDGRGPLLTHPVPVPARPVHQVDAYRSLLAPLGSASPAAMPTLAVRPGDREEARRLLAAVGARAGAPVVGLQLGAAMGPAKLWAPAALAALAGALETRGMRAVFLGAPAAATLLEAVRACATSPPRSLVGRDRPEILPALLAELDVLVGADSGPAHLAAAVGTATVTLFGPTDPRLTAPRGPRQRALWRQPACAPCFLARCPIDHRCLDAIRWEEVEVAVQAALAG
jgi:heptosyltransferase-2